MGHPGAGIDGGVGSLGSDLNLVHAQSRQILLVALASAGLPIAAAFLYAAIFQQAMWAYKPFIGAMYLIFLLAGAGFARITRFAFRVIIAFGVVGLAVLSLLPYYTVWQKSDASAAFRSVLEAGEQEAVLLERSYLAPLAWYYLRLDVPLLGVNAYDLLQPVSLAALHFGDTLLVQPRQLTCDDTFVSSIELFRVYGVPARIRTTYPNWPGCVLEKELWLFETGKWMKLHP